MSKRETGWKEIIESQKVREWLIDNVSDVLQLTNDDFSAVGYQPVRVIPTYAAAGLPRQLTKRGIELLRSQVGGCLLIKTHKAGLPTLYPKIEEPSEEYSGLPFHFIPKMSFLMNLDSTLINEETGPRTDPTRPPAHKSAHPSEDYFFERLLGLRSLVWHFLHFFALSGLVAPQYLHTDLYSK